MSYDFEKNEMTQGGVTQPIVDFVVGFETPFGLFETLEGAVEKCKSLDMDPTLLIQPVVVIKDATDRYEIFLRGK